MVEIYDTTLRDGTQREGISLTVEEKLKVAVLLDDPSQQKNLLKRMLQSNLSTKLPRT